MVDAHVHLDLHPTHPTAVTAFLTGSQPHVPHLGLEAADWEAVADNTLVLARIDHEEPYWAADAARQLRADGIAVSISPRLRSAIEEEWTWVDYPLPWCTRTEVREVSNEAQKIYDDIRHGHLLIHAHARDGHTTVAIGTYLKSGKSVYLHGENHLRQIGDTFDSPAQALTAFERMHADSMRPGPALPTDTERAAAEARTSLITTSSAGEPSPRTQEIVPAYAADPGDHAALLDTFLEKHPSWQKWRTWSDDTTHAIYEDQTLRIELLHDAEPGDVAWTVAAYETPVSDRAWVLQASGATPAPVLTGLLDHLTYGDGWDPVADTTELTEKAVATATQPLSETGWKHTVVGLRAHWTAPADTTGIQAGVELDASHTARDRATWTLWAGPDADHPTWTLTGSLHTPSLLLADLAEQLARGTGTLHPRLPLPKTEPSLRSMPPSTPAFPTPRGPGPRR